MVMGWAGLLCGFIGSWVRALGAGWVNIYIHIYVHMAALGWAELG